MNNYYQQNYSNYDHKDIYYDLSKKFSIKVTQIEEFPVTKSQYIVTDTQLAASLVNPIFSRIYKDFFGSSVTINRITQEPEVILSFRPGQVMYPAAPTVAFEPVIVKRNLNGRSLIEQQMRIESTLNNSDNYYKITSDGEEGIVDFLTDFNEKHPLRQIYKGRIIDKTGQYNPYGGVNIPSEKQILGLSLMKLAKYAWGKEEKDGKPIYYLIESSPYTTMVTPSCKWIFTISRMTQSQYEAICDMTGIPSGMSGMTNIVTTVNN